jgi:transposase
MGWDRAVIGRDQLVLFSERLDEVLPEDHLVRQIDEILGQIDWRAWEALYSHMTPGRPPIHPRVMSGIILYGLLKGIRSSRRLEESLHMRLDFRWLAEGRTIDHSTLCRFRQSHSERLKDLFVQVVLIAKLAGVLSLVELAVDGTKIRSQNHRSKKYKVDDLKALQEQLRLRFDELHAEAEALDAQEVGERAKIEKRQQSVARRQAEIKRAIEAVEELKKSDQPIPTRIPATDVESRVTKSKEGGFAPNYTPVNVVDPQSGLIVSTEVIADCNEKSMLAGALDEVESDFGERPERVLADAIFNHGSNLNEMKQRDIELYTPIEDPANNPAIRENPTEPVSAEQWQDLPIKDKQLSSAAFVYDAERNSYFCPQGKELEFKSSYTHKLSDGSEIQRHRYQASAADCAHCPLFEKCVKGKSKSRTVSRDDAEELREELRQRMRTDAAQEIYDRRMQCERPFATIKQQMGIRQFLHRGLNRVRQEWLWAVTAFNLQRLINILRARPGPIDLKASRFPTSFTS